MAGRSRTCYCIFAICALLCCGAAIGKNNAAKVVWLSKHAVRIRSIQIEDADFSDLNPLVKLIGDARIVELGEESHGDGAAFQAKARLIRFLHEKMGFGVLAWESGFFDCEEMNAKIASDVRLQDAAQSGVFNVWSESRDVLPIFDYARSTLRTAHPLRQTGFDIQGSYRDLLDQASAFAGFPRQALINPRGSPDRGASRASMERLLDLLRTKNGDEKRRAFLVKSLEAFLAIEFRPPGKRADYRDRKMGENIVWLAKTWYPGKKMIVWAANFHAATALNEIGPEKGFRTMTDVVRKEFGSQVYSIGFTAYQGQAGNQSRHDSIQLPVPVPDSLEALLHAAGMRFSFLDLRGLPGGHWLRRSIYAAPLLYETKTSVWPNHFDALFFTDRMFPSLGLP